MDAASALLVLVAAGVNFGWQPAENAADGYEYIVQIEPELLDTLRRGESMPIESNVPPEVGPIRKVSIVVGRGEVPRDTFRAVQRTAYFAGQGTWTPDRFNTAPPASAPATTSTYDRYGQLPAMSPSGVSPPPSVIDRRRPPPPKLAPHSATVSKRASKQRTSNSHAPATRLSTRRGTPVRSSASSCKVSRTIQSAKCSRRPTTFASQRNRPWELPALNRRRHPIRLRRPVRNPPRQEPVRRAQWRRRHGRRRGRKMRLQWQMPRTATKRPHAA